MKQFVKKIRAVFVVLHHSIACLFEHLVLRKDDTIFWKRLKALGMDVLKIGEINLTIIGKEHVKPHQHYVFVSNHASQFDIPALLASIDQVVWFLYKEELHYIPFLGWAMKLAPAPSVNRNDPRSANESLERGISIIRNGTSMIVYAEGTRSRDGHLQPFKRGAFAMAARGGAPIIPIAISGSQKILPSGSSDIHAGEIVVRILPPIDVPEKTTSADEKRLMNLVYQQIAEHLPDEQKPHAVA